MTRLRAVNVQIMRQDRGVLVRRGRLQMQVSGPEAEGILLGILHATEGQGATIEEICASFAAPHREEVARLVEALASRRLLVADDRELAPAAGESALDVFYWHLGLRADQAAHRVSALKTAILGVNCISRQMDRALSESGVVGFEVVDQPFLRNARFFDDGGTLRSGVWSGRPAPIAYDEWSERSETVDCIVATSDFGEQLLMREFNAFCLQFDIPFLPVVLQDFVGYVGPLVIPGETACFECLRGRQNAHLDDPEAARQPETHAFSGQAVNGFHPSMASVVGDLAAIELTKFALGVFPGRVAGTLVEVNLFSHHLVARKVLKLPRCPACSNLNRRAPASPDRLSFPFAPDGP